MSGHSKWSTIKRKKGLIDAERGKIFQKLAKEIFVAAKNGDANPENNPSLRMVIDKARSQNMPKDKIQAAIDKAHGTGNEENYEAIRYEGYGPSGVAIMVDCLTDNRNRTASAVRSTFSKRGGNLGTDGSVSYMFDKKGVIIIPNTYDEEEAMMIAIDSGAQDFESEDETYIITTEPNDFETVKKALEENNITNFLSAYVTYVAANTIDVDDEKQEKIMNLINALDDLDDVQEVYHNMK